MISIRRLVKPIFSFIKRQPELSLALSVVLMFVLVIISNLIRRPAPPSESTQAPTKSVTVFQIGTAPRTEVTGKVEKQNVMTIMAQAAGVVKAVAVKEGMMIKSGAQLASFATTYTGGNAASISRQIAEKQYEQTTSTFETQKSMLANQKEIAEKTENNAEKLREIGRQSLDETRNQLSFSESILNTLDQNLRSLETATNAAENAQLIMTTKQLKSQYIASVNQLKQAIRINEYQTSDDAIPADLARLQKDITIKQIDIQEKALSIGKEIATLNLSLARLTESLMYPRAPFAGTIERVYIKPGQMVNPGAPLVILKGNQGSTQIVAAVAESIAKSISKLEPATLTARSTSFTATPLYVSTEPTHDRLYSVLFNVPDQYAAELSNNEYVTISLPVGYPETSGTMPFIPVDALYQSQDESHVFVIDNGKAQAVKVIPQTVFGRYVFVEGLKAGDQVILNRTVLSGDGVVKK